MSPAIWSLLVQKNRRIIWTINIFGLIVKEWKVWPNYRLFVCPQPSPAFGWWVPTKSMALMKVRRLSFSLTSCAFRPLTFALILYLKLLPSPVPLGSVHKRADSTTCSRGATVFIPCLRGAESISFEPSVTLYVRRQTANLWSTVTQVLNVAQPCRRRMGVYLLTRLPLFQGVRLILNFVFLFFVPAETSS